MTLIKKHTLLKKRVNIQFEVYNTISKPVNRPIPHEYYKRNQNWIINLNFTKYIHERY